MNIVLLSTIIYSVIHLIETGNNAIVRFFALRSTKWSMANVMVVSIFMAYLELDSMIENELKKLVEQSAPVNAITSNGTNLQVGFFLFLGFVFTSFVLSILVERSRKNS